MPEEFLEVLKKITQKDLHELTEYDITFLRARESYLTPEEKNKFAKVLGIEEEKKEIETKEEKKKKGRSKKSII